jgi:hypothetical protein
MIVIIHIAVLEVVTSCSLYADTDILEEHAVSIFRVRVFCIRNRPLKGPSSLTIPFSYCDETQCVHGEGRFHTPTFRPAQIGLHFLNPFCGS